MTIATLHNGLIYDFGQAFANVVVPNNVLSALNLFKTEAHNVNRIALDRLLSTENQAFKENAMYVASDFNTVDRPKLSSYMYQLIYNSSVDSVTSRDVEQYRSKKGYNIQQSIQEVAADLALAQIQTYYNTKENYLQACLLDGIIPSNYADQGDLNLYTQYGVSKTSFTFDTSETASIPQQLDDLNRKVRVVSKGQTKNLSEIFMLVSGTLANALRYHSSVESTIVNVLSTGDTTNFITQYQELLPAFPVWKYKGVTFVDVTGETSITDRIGENGGVVIPSFSSNVMTYHTGVGTKHATLGKDAGEFHQYSIMDDRWGFPTITAESSFLPINQLPQSIIFCS